MNRIRLAVFKDRTIAEPIRDYLIQVGIPAEVHDELDFERRVSCCDLNQEVRTKVEDCRLRAVSASASITEIHRYRRHGVFRLSFDPQCGKPSLAR